MYLDVQAKQPGFAGEITNFDINDIDEKGLRHMLQVYGVIFIRDQCGLDFETLERVMSIFGPLKDISDRPSSNSTATENKYIRTIEYDGRPVDFPAGWFWHAETSYDENRPATGLLYMTNVPPCGGDTLFADQRMAYSQLSLGMKSYVKNLTCMHEVGYWFKNKPKEGTEQHIVEHHPVTGEPYLNVSEIFTTRINGVPYNEGQYLLSFLKAHATNDLWVHRHTWTEGCIAIWDDRLVQHKAVHNFNRHDRFGYRLTTQ